MGRWTTVALLGQAAIVTAVGQIIAPSEEQLLYRQLPACMITTVSHHQVGLETLWQIKPVILVFIFSRCAGSCSPLLATLASATEQLDRQGISYTVVVASFDSTDTPETLAWLNRAYGDRKWIIGVLDSPGREQLLTALNFTYVPVAGGSQFDHPSVVYVIGQGKIVRILTGYAVEPQALQVALRQAQGEFIPAFPVPDPRVPFRCIEYDPRTQSVWLSWGIGVLFLPVIVGIMLSTMIFLHANRFNH